MSATEGSSQAVTAYNELKRDLMAGNYQPGQKLKPDDVRADFGISTSAMREVFLRLSHEHLLVQAEQRGFYVPECTERRLHELTETRILLECEGIRHSIANGDIDWEVRLTAAFHSLAHLETKMQDPSKTDKYVPLWTSLDWDFHDTLLSACTSQVLRETHRNVYEQYRQQVAGFLESAGFREETLPEHEAILKCALARDLEGCREAMESHLRCFQADVCRQGDGDPPRKKRTD